MSELVDPETGEILSHNERTADWYARQVDDLLGQSVKMTLTAADIVYDATENEGIYQDELAAARGWPRPKISMLRAISKSEHIRCWYTNILLPSNYTVLYELAITPPDLFEKAAKAGEITHEMTHAEARRIRRPKPERPVIEMPVGQYGVIYADPPWRYEHVKTESRAIENQYPTMELDDICALPVGDIAYEDSVLFLWATSPKLAESMRVIDSWGFTYRTCAVWVKDKIGMGYYFRQRHELLLVGAKGSLPVPEPSDRLDSVIEAPRDIHSRKPECVYGILETMYPSLPKIELFCRRPREGWSAWGNEV